MVRILVFLVIYVQFIHESVREKTAKLVEFLSLFFFARTFCPFLASLHDLWRAISDQVRFSSVQCVVYGMFWSLKLRLCEFFGGIKFFKLKISKLLKSYNFFKFMYLDASIFTIPNNFNPFHFQGYSKKWISSQRSAWKSEDNNFEHHNA